MLLLSENCLWSAVQHQRHYDGGQPHLLHQVLHKGMFTLQLQSANSALLGQNVCDSRVLLFTSSDILWLFRLRTGQLSRRSRHMFVSTTLSRKSLLWRLGQQVCLSCPMIIDLSIYNCFCPILSRTTMQVALYEFVCAQDVAINSMHECAKMYISCNLCRSSSYV